MTDLRKAAEMALEALETDQEHLHWKIVRTLRQALAQPEQEPVYAFRRKGLNDFCTCDKRRYDELASKPDMFEVAVFYTTPPSIEAAVLAERKACAKLCDEYAENSSNPMNFAENCAVAIRARSEK